jgi:hypothetical protein
MLMFYDSGLIFDGTESAGSSFHVLRSLTHFGRYQGRKVQLSYFAFQDSFLAVPSAHGPVFMFCSPELIFGGIESAGFDF